MYNVCVGGGGLCVSVSTGVFLCTWVLEQVTDLVIIFRSVPSEALLVSGCRMCV